MELTKQIQNYIDGHGQEAYELLLELAQIPAPSNHEEKRAVFCRDWLQKQGAGGVYLDDALNVIYPVGCTETNELVVFMAHSDVVFPDMEDLPLKVEEGRICCPGVGDDTANVVALLMAAKFLAEYGLTPAGCGLLDVLLVKKVSRAQVPMIIGKYKDGRYKELPHLVKHMRVKELKIRCDKATPINLDGELRTAQVVDFSVTEEKLRFFYPKGLVWRLKESVLTK